MVHYKLTRIFRRSYSIITSLRPKVLGSFSILSHLNTEYGRKKACLIKLLDMWNSNIHMYSYVHLINFKISLTFICKKIQIFVTFMQPHLYRVKSIERMLINASDYSLVICYFHVLDIFKS